MPSTVGIVASGAPSFSPLDLSPALWLDAADTSTITESSGSVSQWDDKSGNGYHVTQATGLKQPTTGSATINGLNALSFDGGDVLVGGTAPVLFADPSTPFEVYVVAQTSTSGTFLSQNISATEGLRQFQLLRGSLPSTVGVVARGNFQSSSRGSVAGRVLLAGFQWDGTNAVLRDGNTTNSVNVGAAAQESSALLKVGARSAGSTTNEGLFFNGSLAEVFIFYRALTNEERVLLDEYLSTKWNVVL